MPVPDVLFDSADTFIANTRRIREAKLLEQAEAADDDDC